MIEFVIDQMIDDLNNNKNIHYVGPTTYECNLDILKTIKKNYIQKMINKNYINDIDLTNIKIKKKIKDKDIDITIKKKEKDNTYNISYSPKLEFLDDYSQEGEIIPINIVTTVLLKSLITNNCNHDIEQLIESISWLWI